MLSLYSNSSSCSIQDFLLLSGEISEGQGQIGQARQGSVALPDAQGKLLEFIYSYDAQKWQENDEEQEYNNNSPMHKQ